MMTDSLSTAVDFYEHSGTTLESLWSIYSGVVLALLGYILGSKSVPGRAKLGLWVGFLVFALSNGWAMWYAQTTYVASVAAIKTLAASDPHLSGVAETLGATNPLAIVGFQGLLSVGTLAAIIAAHIHDRRSKV
jgi:hypothetical protein